MDGLGRGEQCLLSGVAAPGFAWLGESRVFFGTPNRGCSLSWRWQRRSKGRIDLGADFYEYSGGRVQWEGRTEG